MNQIKEPEQGYSPTSLEEEEQKTGYFAAQARSEFAQIVERERYNQRRGKVLFLRSLGRLGRLSLAPKYKKRWQEAL